MTTNVHNIKIIIPLFFIWLGLTSLVQAKEYGLDSLISKMKTDLNLTDEQVIAIKPIVKENLTQRMVFLESLESEAVIDKKAIKSTVRKLNKEENEKLAKILTKEQMDRWIEKQNLKERLNADNINYKEYLSEGVVMTPQGGSFQF